MGPVDCPDPDELTAFSGGDLGWDRIEAVGRHVDGCTRCCVVLGELGASDPLLRELAETPSDPYLDEDGCRTAVDRFAALPAGGTPRPTDPAPAPEMVHLKDYQVLGLIGRGGMGAVYRARHVHLRRLVAIKLLPVERLHDPRALERFRREIEAVARLDHPHIVRASDAREEAGMLYLVMDYVEGLDLSRVVKARGPLSVADACEVARQAALALAHAHEHALVHRDVKPSNLMLAGDGRVRLLDLGLARARGEQSTWGELTEPGQIMGTVDYMAPEQAADSHEADIRADIYSLGATLFYLLTGRPPFAGPRYRTLWAVLHAHQLEAAPDLATVRPDVPAGLARLVARLLAKDPADRFADPGEVALALQPFAAGADLKARLAEARASAPTEGDGVRPETVASVPPKPAPLDSESWAPVRPPTGPGRTRGWLVVATLLLAGLALVACWLLPPRVAREHGPQEQGAAEVLVPEGSQAESVPGEGEAGVSTVVYSDDKAYFGIAVSIPPPGRERFFESEGLVATVEGNPGDNPREFAVAAKLTDARMILLARFARADDGHWAPGPGSGAARVAEQSPDGRRVRVVIPGQAVRKAAGTARALGEIHVVTSPSFFACPLGEDGPSQGEDVRLANPSLVRLRSFGVRPLRVRPGAAQVRP